MNIITALWRGQIGRWLLLAIPLAAVLLPVLPDRLVFEVLLSFGAAIGVAVLVSYGKGFCEAVTAPRATQGGMLVTGIVLSWGGTLILRLYSIVIRVFPRFAAPENDVIGFAFVLIIIGGVCHLRAEYASPEIVPTRMQLMRGWLWFVVSLALFAAIELAPYLLR